MRLSCDVIKDLMPLYVEGMLSEESVKLVEEHIEHCDDCKSFLKAFHQNQETPEDRNIMPMLKLKSSLRKKKAVVIALSITLTLLFSAILFSFLSAPNYIPYSEELLEVSELADGSVIVQFNQEVHGYDINQSATEIGEGIAYDITAWTTVLGEAGLAGEVDRFILNTEEEEVSSVYYYHIDGMAARLVYGRDEYPNGGSITLPRLTLDYYLWLADFTMVVSLIAIGTFRNNKQVVRLLRLALLLSTSYIISHLVVLGVTSASYYSTRDLLAILLIAIPLCLVMLLGLNLYAIKRDYRNIKIEK